MIERAPNGPSIHGVSVFACVATAALFGTSDVAVAQKAKGEPPRPHLPSGVDTNNARVYYDYGLGRFDRDPEEAANAFNVNVQSEINRWLFGAPASVKAWRAYGEGRFDDALRLYADAIKDARFKAQLRADRGRVFFQVGELDSALVELTQSLDELRKTDKKDLVYVYESKTLLEHSIGLVHQRLGNTDAAKEAFARALQEDLAYFPAHLQLAYLALNVRDSTTALSETDLAVQIRPDDPTLRYADGYALTTSGRFEDAEAQLRKASELDPFFATPYFLLAVVLDSQGKGPEALAEYRSFLARASAADPRRKEAEQNVRELTMGESKE